MIMITNKNLYWVILFCLYLVACSTDNNSGNNEPITVENEEEKPIELITKTEYGPDSSFKIIYQVDKNTNKKHGKYQEFDGEGRLLIEQSFVGDQAEGVEKNYYESGQVEGEISQERGLYHGPFKYYYIDGTLKQEGTYIDNKMEGVLKTYYADGTLKEEVSLIGGLTEGPFVEYNPNGTLKAKGTYGSRSEVEELERGELLEYDENGVLIAKKICKEGRCCEIWTLKRGRVKPSNKLCGMIISSMQKDTINEKPIQ
jgi:antitoxin component YwqK of YwqJK toxin-antitoxin module